jgi:alkylation response protein AidB-like acyl-CoA dehydrogenase
MDGRARDGEEGTDGTLSFPLTHPHTHPPTLTHTGRILRDAKLYEIGAGTSEIRRLVVARALVGPHKAGAA